MTSTNPIPAYLRTRFDLDDFGHVRPVADEVDVIIHVFGTAPVLAALLCRRDAEVCYNTNPAMRSAVAYAEMAVDYANTARVARRVRARVYKSNDYSATDPAVESVFDRSWHSALRCIKRAFTLMQTA